MNDIEEILKNLSDDDFAALVGFMRLSEKDRQILLEIAKRLSDKN